MTEEIWKPVVGFGGLYEVSNLGRLKSLNRTVVNLSGEYIKKGAIKKISSNNRGYHIVTLTKDGTSKQYGIHRLVAEAFIPNPNNLPEVDHIDRNPSNNIVGNLRWCTHKENLNNDNTIQYMKEHVDKRKCSMLGISAKISRNSISAPKQVFQYTKDGNYIATYESHNEASRITGINRSAIEQVLNKTEYSAGGYLWTTEFKNSLKYKRKVPSFFKPIQQINSDGCIVGEWDSMTKAAKALNISRKYISARIKTGEFRYKNEGE